MLAHETFFSTGEYSLQILAEMPWWRRMAMPTIGGILVGLIVTRFAPEVKGSGIPEVMESVARKGGAIRFRVVITKAVAAAVTLGSGGSAGREGPIVHIGSAIGSTLGQFLQVPPRMLTCVLSVLLAGRLHRNSIYTEKLAQRGIHLFEGRDVNLLGSIEVRDVMDESPKVVDAGMPFTELLPVLLSGRHREVLVIDDQRRYLGAVALDDIKEVLPETHDLAPLAVAADAVNDEIPFVLPGDTLDVVMHLFGRTHRNELPVCKDPNSREIVGIVSRDVVIESYNQRIF